MIFVAMTSQQTEQQKTMGRPCGLPIYLRCEMAIYLLAPRLYGIFYVAITAITFLSTRPKGQPFKSVREHHFSVVVP